MLGEREIELFNRLEARGDPDKERYNKEIYEPYLSKFVQRGANMKKYRLPKMIKPNYVTPQQVKKMIDDKYRRGNFNINSDEEIKKLYKVAENIFNNMEDPQDSMKTVSAKTYDRSLTDTKTEENQNLPFPSTNSITDVLPDFFAQESKKKMFGEGDGDSEDDTDTESATGGDITSRALDINQINRREEYNIMSGDNVLNNHK
jgi:hypothetical protein